MRLLDKSNIYNIYVLVLNYLNFVDGRSLIILLKVYYGHVLADFDKYIIVQFLIYNLEDHARHV